MNPIGNRNLEHKAVNWKKCDVNRLAGYFHRFSYNHAQFQRLGCLRLGVENTEALFRHKGIRSFQIFLGADSEKAATDYFTFRPVIYVCYDDDTHKEVEFNHYEPEAKYSLTARVPAEFSNWLTKNWRELDMSLIDDAFTAFLPVPRTEPVVKVKQRLMSYCFTPDNANAGFLKFIQDHRLALKDLIFHLGIDMNKFAHKDFFSFSPVFELTMKKAATDSERLTRFTSVHQAGLRGVVVGEDETDEPLLYEYSSPCPSSC